MSELLLVQVDGSDLVPAQPQANPRLCGFLPMAAHVELLPLHCCRWGSILQPSCWEAALLKIASCDLSSDVFGLVCLRALH